MNTKRIYLSALFLGILTLFSCRKENTPESLNEQTLVSASDSVLFRGTFVNSRRHDASGTVTLYESASKHIVQIENLKVDNGPDLRVYLSKSTDDDDFIELGKLKAVSGNFGYSLDKRANISEYRYVLVWCEDFSVLFGSAELK